MKPSFCAIGWMIDAIVSADRAKGIGIYPFEAADVVTILMRVRPSLVMRVDPTVRAEVMFGSSRVELIYLQELRAADYFDSRQ